MKANRDDFTMPLQDIVLCLLESGISSNSIERAFIEFSASSIQSVSKWIFNGRLRFNDYQFWAALKRAERSQWK